MTDEPAPFIDYWDACDTAMSLRYGIDTMEIDQLTADMIAHAQEDGWTAEQFAIWAGAKFGLSLLPPSPAESPA